MDGLDVAQVMPDHGCRGYIQKDGKGFSLTPSGNEKTKEYLSKADYKKRFETAAKNARSALTMTKVCIRQAVAQTPFPRWHFVTFAGPGGVSIGLFSPEVGRWRELLFIGECGGKHDAVDASCGRAVDVSAAREYKLALCVYTL